MFIILIFFNNVLVMKRIVFILCATLLVIPSCKKNKQESQEIEKETEKESENPQYSAKDVQAIDLGLSVLWADRNIGAESPEDPGHFFAWGETTARNLSAFARPYIFDEADAPLMLSGEYDTATALWGEGWRMPTKAELNELNTLSGDDKKDGEGNVIGIILSGNGNSIVIPYADPDAQTKSLSLWSSERSGTNAEWAYYYYVHKHGIENGRREYAHAVRAVKDK